MNIVGIIPFWRRRAWQRLSWLAGLLAAISATSAEQVTRGPYLQRANPSSLVVRWRTDVPTNSEVRFGIAPEALLQRVSNPASTTEHELALTGLSAQTRYYYSVGTTAGSLASGADYSFVTPPSSGSSQATRIWILGDSGTANANAAAVRDAYLAFAGTRYTDLWLMLGDNAYNTGTDAEYQAAVFDMYPRILRQSVLWPALGNHDTAFSTSPAPTIPYFNIFTLPTSGEGGGIASGTEKYYSFDYGRIHFICLDSMSSNRTPGSPMLTWLHADLEATTQDWIIAYWHHPPYTKGSHDSDRESELVEMRRHVVPLLEAGGVDLVLTGHSHNYERSFLINGHYGLSSSFDQSMQRDTGNGREDESGAYRKPPGLAANQGAVYAVAGTSGQATFWTGGSRARENPTPHPVMFRSLLELGSMILDVEGERLDAKFLRADGVVDDSFTIRKNIVNVPPESRILLPKPATRLTGPAKVTIAAAATDRDGYVARVDFYVDDILIGAATTEPFSVDWSGGAEGSHILTATAIDDLGMSTTSAPVSVTVREPTATPATQLVAEVAGSGRVELSWSDGAIAERKYRLEQSGDGIIFKHVATLRRSRTTFRRARLNPKTTYYFRVRALNEEGSTYSNVVSVRPDLSL